MAAAPVKEVATQTWRTRKRIALLTCLQSLRDSHKIQADCQPRGRTAASDDTRTLRGPG